MREAAAIVIGTLVPLLLAASLHDGVAQTVRGAAVWRPPAGFMARFHSRCDAARGGAFDTCFAAEMAKAGAPPAALDFTRQLGNEAYLAALVPTGGPVAVAHVVYPFRANENDAWLLINGKPPLVDVDNQRYLDLGRLRASPAYNEISRQYPNVTFWPGARGSSGPQIAQRGRNIIVSYLLRDLCRACAIVGRVRYAFVFAADGSFLGTRLLSVTPTAG